MTVADTSPAWQPAVETAPVGARFGRLRDVWSRVSGLLGLRPAGWWVLAVGAVLLIAGAQLGWIEFIYAGVFALAVGVMALLFTLGRPRYEVRLTLDAPHVVVGTPAGGVVEVGNRAARRSIPTRMDVPVDKDTAVFSVPWLGPGKGFNSGFDIPTERRSVITVGPAQTIQGDPFGLTGRGAIWTEALELYVHPKTVALPGRQAGLIHDLEGHASTQLTNSDMSFHALREYVPGDDRRHVHWKSSARVGNLMVRQFEETRQSRVCVAVDVAEQSYANTEEFELAISVGASVVLQAFREGNPLALVTTTELIPALSAVRSLDEMCRIESVSVGGPADLVEVVLDHEAAASVVVWITGGRIPQRTMYRVSSRFDADVRVIAIRVDEQADLSARTLGNVSYVQVADLADLPRAMRRASQ